MRLAGSALVVLVLATFGSSTAARADAPPTKKQTAQEPTKKQTAQEKKRQQLLDELGLERVEAPPPPPAPKLPAPSAGAWWYVVPPGLCITILVLAVSMLGFLFEEYINPRLREAT